MLVDGQPAGQAPLALDVPAGDHEITAEADGARAVSQRLLVLPGESLSVHLALVQASKIPAPPLIAVVTQPPGATLFLDGKEQGTTPRKVTSTPGPHEVKLVLEGLAPRTVKLNVPDRHDYELRLAVTLQPGRPQGENTPVDPLALARAWLARAGSCYRQGDYACALENYQKAYQYKPKPDLLFNIGHAQRRLKEYTKAAAAYRAFIKEAPRSPMRREAEKLAALCELLAQGHKEPPADEDTTPPSLQHEPIARALRAQPLRVAAKISDDRSGVAGQQLCYRNFFQREYQCAPLVNENEGELYTFDIPAAAVTDGLAYYLEAYDNAGNGPSRSGTPEGPHTVGIADELSELPGPAAAAKADDNARAQVATREQDEAGLKVNAAPQEAVSTRTTLFARTRMVTWVMAGAGAAVLGTGLVFGHLASVLSANATTSPSNLALQDLAQRQATASTALVSIGGTLLVAAVANEVIDLMTPVAAPSP